MNFLTTKGTKQISSLLPALLIFLSQGTVANPVCNEFAYLPEQPYALCAGADTWNFDGITYAKCAKKNGNSISLKQSYPQCDGGICFSNTSGKVFPGLGQIENSQIVCSCPITTSSSYEVFGPAECPKTRAEYDQICGSGLKSSNNGMHLKIGSPGKHLTVQELSDCYTQNYESKPVANLARCERPAK